MDNNQWRDRAKRLSDSGAEMSKKVKNQISETAPVVSKRVQEQIKTTAPVVAHKAREVGKALTAPVPPQESVAPQYRPPIADPVGTVVPAYPPAPQELSSPATVSPQSAPSRPTAVTTAYLALGVAALASAILAGFGVYSLTELRGSVDNVVSLDRSGTAALFANGYVDKAEMALMSTTVGLGIVFTLAYVLVAYAVRKGHGWPRPVGTVLAVLSLPLVFLGPVAIGVVLAGIVAVIALWTPAARNYVAEAKAAKQSRRVGWAPS